MEVHNLGKTYCQHLQKTYFCQYAEEFLYNKTNYTH
jgi:hypothetical protein